MVKFFELQMMRAKVGRKISVVCFTASVTMQLICLDLLGYHSSRHCNKYAIWALLLSLVALITCFQQQLTVFYSWYCRNAKNLSVYSGGSRPSDTGGGVLRASFCSKNKGEAGPPGPSPGSVNGLFCCGYPVKDPPVFLSGLPPGTRSSENSLRWLGSSFVSARKNPALGTSTTLCI